MFIPTAALLQYNAAVAGEAWRSTNLSLAPSTPTAVTFDTAIFDTSSFWSAGSPTRLTLPRTGIYFVWAKGEVDSGGSMFLKVRLNGTTMISGDRMSVTLAGLGIGLNDAFGYSLTAGDYLELIAEMSGGTANVVSSTISPFLGAALL